MITHKPVETTKVRSLFGQVFANWKKPNAPIQIENSIYEIKICSVSAVQRKKVALGKASSRLSVLSKSGISVCVFMPCRHFTIKE